MQADSPLDWQIKGSLLADCFNLVGINRVSKQRLAEATRAKAKVLKVPGKPPGPPERRKRQLTRGRSALLRPKESVEAEDAEELYDLPSVPLGALELEELRSAANALRAVQHYAVIVDSQEAMKPWPRGRKPAERLTSSQVLASLLFGPPPSHGAALEARPRSRAILCCRRIVALARPREEPQGEDGEEAQGAPHAAQGAAQQGALPCARAKVVRARSVATLGWDKMEKSGARVRGSNLREVDPATFALQENGCRLAILEYLIRVHNRCSQLSHADRHKASQLEVTARLDAFCSIRSQANYGDDTTVVDRLQMACRAELIRLVKLYWEHGSVLDGSALHLASLLPALARRSEGQQALEKLALMTAAELERFLVGPTCDAQFRALLENYLVAGRGYKSPSHRGILRSRSAAPGLGGVRRAESATLVAGPLSELLCLPLTVGRAETPSQEKGRSNRRVMMKRTPAESLMAAAAEAGDAEPDAGSVAAEVVKDPLPVARSRPQSGRSRASSRPASGRASNSRPPSRGGRPSRPSSAVKLETPKASARALELPLQSLQSLEQSEDALTSFVSHMERNERNERLESKVKSDWADVPDDGPPSEAATTTARELIAEVHARRARDPRKFQEAMRDAGRRPNPSVYRLEHRIIDSSRPLAERYPGKREFNLQDLEAMRVEEAIGNMPLYAKEYETSLGQASTYGQLVSRSYDPKYLARRALDETNIFRGSQKIPPLKWCQGIADIAAEHARQMARGEMPFSHDGFHDRVKRYPIPHLSAAECSCGMTLHSEVALKAHQLFSTEVANVSSILAQHPEALIAGAPFPDYLYACEDAHWHTFHAKAAKYIREKYPNWQNGDEHGAKLDNITRNFGLGFLQFLGEIDYGCQGRLCQTAHSEGDTGGEFVIHHQLRSTGNIQPLQWFIPVADLVEIFHREPQAHPNVSSRWIVDSRLGNHQRPPEGLFGRRAKECGVEFRAAVEAVRFGGELLFPKYARPGPFLQDISCLVAWQKFLHWLLDGPPDVPPPELILDTRTKSYALRELLSLGKPHATDVAVLPEGAVLIGPQATRRVASPTHLNETGLYGYDGSSVLFCDVDGDGDLEDCNAREISGAPGWSLPGKPLLGQVNIRKPSTGGTVSLPAPDAHVGGFGHSLACGDFDADGIDDLAVGSPTRGPIDQVFERQAYSGRVDVFFGSKGGLTNPCWSASAIGPADLFGFSLQALPAAPGTPQRLAVGSPYFGRDDAEQMRPGKVHVFAPRRHSAVTVAEAEEEYAGWQAGEKFGSCICAQGQELFIGAPGHFAHGNSSTAAVGAIYTVSHGQFRSVLSGTEPHGRFGHSCGILGSKLAVGQPGKSKKVFLHEDIYAGAVLLLDMASALQSNGTLRGDEQDRARWLGVDPHSLQMGQEYSERPPGAEGNCKGKPVYKKRLQEQTLTGPPPFHKRLSFAENFHEIGLFALKNTSTTNANKLANKSEIEVNA
eukprot:s691_g6.t1